MFRLQGSAVRLLPVFLLGGLCVGLAVAAEELSVQDSPEHYFQVAQTYQLAADWDRAEAAYRRAAARGLHRLGNLAVQEDRFEEAVRLLEAAVALEPSYLEARVDLAIAHFHSGNASQAIELTETVLEEAPGHARARHLAGKLYFLQGDFEPAVGHLELAVAQQPDFEAAYALAIAYLRLKQLSKAMLLFDEMRVSVGASAELLTLIGRAYRETGFHSQALAEFQKALSQDPHIQRAHYYMGLTHLLQGGSARFPEAREHFKAELEINPDHYLSRFYLGVIYFSDRNFPAAEAELEQAAHLRPASPDAYFYLGQIYLQTGRTERAAQVLRQSIELTKDFRHNNYQLGRAHYLLAQALRRLERPEEAKKHLARSEELRAKAFRLDQHRGEGSVEGTMAERGLPDLSSASEQPLVEKPSLESSLPEAAQEYQARLEKLLGHSYHNLGVLRARQKDYVQAMRYFERAARCHPSLESLDRHWGLAAFRARRYEEAIAPLARQLEREPGDRQVRQMLGLSYFMNDQFEQTAEVFAPLLAEPPEDPGLLFAWGTALVRSGQEEDSLRVFSLLLERNPDAPEVHLLLGQAYAQQNQQSAAREEFRRALELNPELGEAHYFMGLILLRQGKLQEAQEHFEFELQVNPGKTAARYHLAYALLLSQRQEQAIGLLREVIQENPEYAEAHYQLGKALLDRGDVKAAIESLEQALKLEPGKYYTYYQLSRAYRRDGRPAEARAALQNYQRLKEKDRAPE